MITSPSTAVLLMAHGTPDSLDDMPAYLTLVRNGRPPSSDLVEEIRSNYAAIGGRSPLTDLTRAQAEALQKRLGPTFTVLVGMRNWAPFIADALSSLRSTAVHRVIGIPLTPQFSTLSVQKYLEAARAALPDGLELRFVQSFHSHPRLIEAFASRVAEARPDLPGEEIVFTAHSLPERVIRSGDPYAEEVAATAAATARLAGIADYQIAYQSAGRTPERWIGPDLSDLIRERAAAGVQRMLVAPIGFVCDHTEILFDIDKLAARNAADCGVALRRTASLNTSPLFIDTIESLVREALENPPSTSS